MRTPQNFVLHASVRDGSPEIVLRIDRGCDLFSKLYGFVRSGNRDFKLRLLVLFDPKRTSAIAFKIEPIVSEFCVFSKFKLTRQTAVFICLDGLFEDVLVLRIRTDDVEILPGKLRNICLVILRVSNPEFELNLLLGSINWSIRNQERLSLVVLSVVPPREPDTVKAQVSQSACIRPSRNQPLIVLVVVSSVDR